VVAPRTVTARTTADRATEARPAKATAKAAPSAPATARPELRVVPSEPVRRVTGRPAGARGERQAPFVLLVVGLLVASTLGLLVLNILRDLDSIAATELREKNALAAQEVQALQREVVGRDTPAALAAAATAAGLVPAGSAAYLVIAPDGSSTLRGAVSPAPEPVKPSRVPADKD
jgi:cell division protein FtsI (penicillin-binding protein 3)